MTVSRWTQSAVLVASLAILCAGVAPAQTTATPATPRQPASTQPALIILVRHAEKSTVGGTDPDLSDAGQARAKALVAAIADAHVTAIVTTTYKRTSQTADPIAAAHNITIEKVGLDGGTAMHVAAVAAAVRKHPGEVVLVVGHSNTIPAIVTALGGPKLPDLCDAAYATLFMLQPARAGAAANVVRVKYGAADPDGAESCTTPMK